MLEYLNAKRDQEIACYKHCLLSALSYTKPTNLNLQSQSDASTTTRYRMAERTEFFVGSYVAVHRSRSAARADLRKRSEVALQQQGVGEDVNFAIERRTQELPGLDVLQYGGQLVYGGSYRFSVCAELLRVDDITSLRNPKIAKVVNRVALDVLVKHTRDIGRFVAQRSNEILH